MPLGDAAIRALKPRDKDYRVADEKGCQQRRAGIDSARLCDPPG
jgi:hypothetical protein